MNKKHLIIKAFEELDAEMLDVLLNDEMSYQDVPKQTFVDALKKYFSEIKKYEDTKIDFKAYKGQCDLCQKGKTGYSFVNSEGQCYMSLVFEEDENDFKDIYNCSCFVNDNIEIENTWLGITFYEEDTTNFTHTNETFLEEKECILGVKEIENEIINNGILESEFYLVWHKKYSHFDSIKRLFDKKRYKYTLEISRYLSSVNYVVSQYNENTSAKKFFDEFTSFQLINEDIIKDWLIRVDYELPYAKYGFEYVCNFLQDYFENSEFKFRLSELYYYHSISEILNKYFDWIPENNPLIPVNEFYDEYAEGEDFPF